MSSTLNEIDERIINYWSNRKNKIKKPLSSPTIIKHINKTICGRPVSGHNEGLIVELKKILGPVKLKHGVSVGCGAGGKEMNLIRKGIVDRFTVFELSGERIKRGHELAEKLNVVDKINFRRENAFEADIGDDIDFVHWNASLHHMFSVRDAVRWSYSILDTGGIFYMHEYVGPNRMQYTHEMLSHASNIRRLLPRRFLKKPNSQDEFFLVKCHAPNPENVALLDPSECVDSENILPSVNEVFEAAKIYKLGGIGYMIALRGIVGNFDEREEEDQKWLQAVCHIDDLLSQKGFYVRAAALATR